VSEIATIVQRTAASSEQSVEACDHLSNFASELASLVGSFKVGRGGDRGGAGASPAPTARERVLALRRVASA